MAYPIAISSIYTNVTLQNRVYRQQAQSDEEIVKQIVEQRNSPDKSSISIAQAFHQSSNMILLGRPGSGKSTILKHLFTRTLDTSKDAKLPIFIALNELRADDTLLLAAQRILEVVDAPKPQSVLDTMLRAGECVILIDGLDEIRENRRLTIVKEINSLMHDYSACNFIVTCRIAAYDYWFPNAYHYETCPFSRRSIAAFVFKWFHTDRRKAKYILNQVIYDQRLRDLCSNPLLLAIVCISSEAGLDISTNRSEIYRDAIDVLLRRWDVTRNVVRDNVYRDLSSKRREDLLSDLAVRTFADVQIAIPNKVAEDIVGAFLDTMPTSGAGKSSNDATVVLQAIEAQHGLIEKRSLHYWAFAHLTFQEYFTAQFVYHSDAQTQITLVNEKLFVPRWKEVIVLTATMMSNADSFVIAILKRMTKLGFGRYFVDRITRDIELAQQSVAHKRFDKASVLTPINRSPFASAKFGVIDGGYRLTVAETRDALKAFKASVRIQGRRPSFSALYSPGDRTAVRKEDTKFMFDEFLDKDATYYISKDVIRNLDIELEKAIASQTSGYIGKIELIPEFRVYTNTYLQLNISAIREVSALFDPNILYDITSGQHTFVNGECLSECINNISVILEPTFDKLHEKVTDIPSNLQILFKNTFVGEIIRLVTEVSDDNDSILTKNRGFLSGDVLADILLSPVFLTAVVRDAAVRTLRNMVDVVIFPPDPPPGNRMPTPETLERYRNPR